MTQTPKSVAPILLVIFNRPDTTNRVFESIKKARPSKLYIAADGPRPSHQTDQKLCESTRDVANHVDWECEVKTLFRDENLGCKTAVASSIDWFFEHEEVGIILEDDCLPSDSFYNYCTELLDKYRDDTRIMMISGTNVNGHSPNITSTYYYSKLMHIWGWATWRRAWQLHDREMKSFPEFLKSTPQQQLFADPNINLFWLSRWLPTYLGKIDSWAYAWVYTCLINNGLSIAPSKNLISNIGFGAESTHTTNPNSKSANIQLHNIEQIAHPTFVISNEEADKLEYEHDLNIFPAKSNCSLKYRFKRRRKRRKYEKRINADSAKIQFNL